MPPRVSIHLFGKPSVTDASGRVITGLSPGKPLALLSYLIVEGKTPREELIALLWGDIPDGKARNAFRQALHRLRSALGEDIVPHDPNNLSVAGDFLSTCDVVRFENLLDAGEIEEAVAEYAGDFLAGLDVGEAAFDEWCDAARKRYKARYRDALRNAIHADLESGNLLRALSRSAALVDGDPGDVEGLLLHASTLLGAGRREEALHAVETFERRYQEDFGGSAPAQVREFLTRLRRGRVEQRGNAPLRQQPRFVGRDAELSLLLTRLRGLESAGGSLVVIEGDRGIGKTRLIEEFFARARDLGPALLLYGRESAPQAGIPYASVAEALRGVLDASGIAGTGQHLLAEAARLLPQLRDQFSLPPIADISDDAGRVRFYEGIAALLDSVAYEQPVCIALDDFHNASATTRGLVEYLADRLRGAPILFVIVGHATRSFTAVRDKLHSTIAPSGATRDGREGANITLGPLDDRSARDLALQLAGSAVDQNLVEGITAASSGIPFRILEACDRARAGEKPETSPVTLRDVLWSRLQRSTQAEQRLFVTVALFDKPVSIRLLAAASHLPEKGALDAALSLERDGLLRQRAEGVAPAHDFSGELALEGTGPAGRALLAGWAAEALERDGSGTSAELARLFALAGRRKEAFGYSRTAAFEAMAAGADDEAKHHFDTALVTAPSRDDREEIEKLIRSVIAGPRLLAGGPVSSAAQPAINSSRARASQGADGAAAETIAEIPGAPAPLPAAPAKSESSTAADASAASGSIAMSSALPRRSRHSIRPALAALGALAVIAFVIFRTVAGFSASGAPGTSLADTLVVARELNPRDTVIAFATGPLGSPLNVLNGATRHGATRSWIDSLRLPWANPLPSPDGRNVAVERITKTGSQLYVISMDRRDTIQLRTGAGDDFSSGWSPDGRWLLATHGETRTDGTYSAQLFGYSILRGGPRIAFDTARSTGVVEAVWSPDGSRVAWTARVGPQHQQDIFISDADGQNVLNVSNSAAEDYSIAWSPDGTTVAFTSERSGRAELYSEDVGSRILRRLTWEGAHADHAAYSPDGRWLAYESTRGGVPAVYVMPSAGGTGRSVTSALERVSLVGWRGQPVPYIDEVFVDVGPLSEPGDTGTLLVRAVDRRGNEVKVRGLRLEILDPDLIRFGTNATPVSDTIPVIARAPGLARVSASAGSWRADTAFIPIGRDALALIEEHFEGQLNDRVWRSLGDPAPIIAKRVGDSGSGGLVARSDREWQSGILGRTVFPIRRGLSADVWVSAPFSEPAAARSFVVALVAADPAEVVDSKAPHFLQLAAVSWLGEAGRISYAVGGETFTEPLSALGSGDAHRVRISVAEDDAVAFYIDDGLRWKSSLRVLTEGANSRAQLWLGSQATGNSVIFDDVVLKLQPALSHKRN